MLFKRRYWVPRFDLLVFFSISYQMTASWGESMALSCYRQIPETMRIMDSSWTL